MKNFIRLLFMMMLTSCAKEELTFTISGIIIDKTYNAPQNSGTIKVFRKPLLGQGITNELIAEVQPDAQGKYSLTFSRDKSEGYIVTFSRDSYFEEEFSIPFSSLSTAEDYSLNFTTETKSAVRWIIEKLTPPGVYGEVKIYKQSGRTTGDGCCANEEYVFNGFVVQDTLFCASGGGSYVKYLVVNLGNSIIYTDSIYCPPTGIGEAVVNF
jgi:hypothetical protein